MLIDSRVKSAPRTARALPERLKSNFETGSKITCHAPARRRLRGLFACLLLAVAGLATAGPRIERLVTSTGVPVLFVAAPEIPMFKVRVVFAAGSAHDGATPGLATLVSGMLGEGTTDLTTDEFHVQLEATGAQLGTGITRDFAYLSLRSLRERAYADPALALTRAALVAPRFDEADLARARRQMLAGLEQAKGSAAALGDKTMHHAIYGEHPYALPADGTEKSVAAFRRDDLESFHRRYYVRENAGVVVVGALTRDEAATLVETLVADLPSGAAAPRIPVVPPLTTASSLHVTFPGTQSHLIFAQPGITRQDPDYFPLVVGNHVLGGNGAVSLLFDEIRERRGLSYSVSSHFEPMAAAGPFVITLQTDHRREQEARQVLEATLARFIADGPDQAALDAAKQNLIGGFPLRIDNNDKLAEYLTIIGFYDLPLDYLDAYPRAVAAVTRDQVREAFARRIAVTRMAKIIVGPAPATP